MLRLCVLGSRLCPTNWLQAISVGAAGCLRSQGGASPCTCCATLLLREGYGFRPERGVGCCWLPPLGHQQLTEAPRPGSSSRHVVARCAEATTLPPASAHCLPLHWPRRLRRFPASPEVSLRRLPSACSSVGRLDVPGPRVLLRHRASLGGRPPVAPWRSL